MREVRFDLDLEMVLSSWLEVADLVVAGSVMLEVQEVREEDRR